jgi:hypothetical protein
MVQSCRLSASQKRRLVQHFTTLHEGLPPAQLSCERFRGPSGKVRPIGRATLVRYLKLTPKGLEPYFHPFEPHAQPKLGLDAKRTPVFWAGRYRVLDGGITDRSPRSVRPEHIPRNPRSLADLGVLEWIEYDPGNGQRPKTLRVSPRHLLVHDEQGNMYAIPTQREEIMKKYGKKNPLAITGQRGGDASPGDILMAFILVGAGEAVASELLGALPPRINGYKRPLVQAALGMGLGYFAAKSDAIPREVALSLGATGALMGLLGTKNEFLLQRAAGASLRGSGAPLGPGGLPPGYAPISRAQCAVRAR